MTTPATIQQNLPGGLPSDPMLPAPYRVARIKRENHDTFTLELRALHAASQFVFLPGQFNMLYVYGVGEVPLSISGDPAQTDRIVHTTRSVGSVTSAMAKLRKGDVIGVRGPFGSGWPIREAEGRDIVIVAGGIGIAPLRPVIYHVLSAADRYRRVVLVYGARTPQDLLFAGEFRKWGKRGIDVQVTVDRATGDWRGNIGVATTLIPRASIAVFDAVAMVCGPEIMMRFAVMALQSYGVARENIYVSMERNMKCAVGLCGHCQYGPEFICKDGPVFPFARIERLFTIREL